MEKKLNKVYLFFLLSFAALVLAIGGCSGNSSSNVNKNDWLEHNLYGKVKSIKEFTYYAVERFGEVEKGEVMSVFKPTTTIFNEQGYVIEKVEYDLDGNIYSKKLYKYDNKETLLEKYKYDSDDNLIEKSFYNYELNEKGYKTKTIDKFSPEDSLKFKFVSEYNSKGNKVLKELYTSEGSKFAITAFKYNGKNRLIESYSIVDFSNDLIPKSTFKYDNKGNRVEIKRYDSKDNFREKSVVEYVYDEKGNWIKSTTSCDLVPGDIKEREIEYFD